MTTGREQTRIELLGGFRVAIGMREIAADAWPTRRSQELVALLALCEGRRLQRDGVIEQLWPHLEADAGAANLRKAAHHARRALDSPEAVVLRSGRVELFPDRTVTVDADEFLREAGRALAAGDAETCAAVAASYRGPLLPDSPYETWAQEPRRRVQARLVDLLRVARDWERLLEVEPTDERACRELMQAAIDAGERHVAIRWYEGLRIALVRELGRHPDAGDPGPARAVHRGSAARGEGFRGPRRRALRWRCADARGRGGADSRARRPRPHRHRKVRLLPRALPAGTAKGGGAPSPSPTRDREGPTPRSARSSSRSWPTGANALSTLPDRTRAILAELTPLAGPAPPLEGAVTRHQVVAALRRALELTGAGTPTLLFLEDAHLLDEATAGVLHQLVAGAGDDPLLVVLACRAEWIRTSLAQGITELMEGERTQTLGLGPLDDAQIAELVAIGAPAKPTLETIDRITSGGGR